MESAFLLGAEVGIFLLPLQFTSPLSLIFWLTCLLAAAVQLLILKKAQSIFAKWALPVLILLCMGACEAACQILFGYELLLPVLIYWLMLGMLLALMIVSLVYVVRARKRK